MHTFNFIGWNKNKKGYQIEFDQSDFYNTHMLLIIIFI